MLPSFLKSSLLVCFFLSHCLSSSCTLPFSHSFLFIYQLPFSLFPRSTCNLFPPRPFFLAILSFFPSPLLVSYYLSPYCHSPSLPFTNSFLYLFGIHSFALPFQRHLSFSQGFLPIYSFLPRSNQLISSILPLLQLNTHTLISSQPFPGPLLYICDLFHHLFIFITDDLHRTVSVQT
jgi:hypothetical protein